MFFNLKIFTAAVSVLAISLSSVMASESAENAVTFETPQALQEAASKITTKFEEGVHYKVIEGATVSEVKEVREFFSFFCGHCHAFLPVIRQVSYALPEDVESGKKLQQLAILYRKNISALPVMAAL